MPPVSRQPVKVSGSYPHERNWVWRLSPPLDEGGRMTTTAPADGWYHKRYRDLVAMNLRLPEDLAAALRELSEETGRSQQELAREALEEYVRDYRLRAYPKDVRHLITPASHPTRQSDPEVLALLQSIGRDRLLAELDEIRADRF